MREPRAPQEWGHEKSYIYAIRSGEHVKIGLTTDIGRRMRQMEALNPHNPVLELYRTVTKNTAPGVEKHMHELLAAWHFRGEWFTAPIEEIRKAAKLAISEAAKVEREDYALLNRPRTEEDIRLTEERSRRAYISSMMRSLPLPTP